MHREERAGVDAHGEMQPWRPRDMQAPGERISETWDKVTGTKYIRMRNQIWGAPDLQISQAAAADVFADHLLEIRSWGPQPVDRSA
mmetsp:Transcript_81191/g.165367  ORF Transcript_81191/g.165367 Transcript_81191/m.165367 type:complete len:86 (+) Transcript_81191:696-953(+)